MSKPLETDRPGHATHRAMILAALCIAALAPAFLAPTAPAVASESSAVSTPEGWTAVTPPTVEELRETQRRLIELLPAAQAATVHVQIGGINGSGIIVDGGYVLTAAHVSGSPGRPVLMTFPDGQHVRGRTLGRLPFRLRGGPRVADAGMIRITDEGEWPSVPMGNIEEVQSGDWCFALGYPGGFDAQRGPVLRLGRIIFKHRDSIWTDCALLGGDSGGPLFDMDGRVIGIHSRIAPPTTRNYHAPIDAFIAHWDTLVSPERRLAFFGVTTDRHERGVVIIDMDETSPAAQAGLRIGDVILRFDETPVPSDAILGTLIRRKSPGDEVEIVVFRGDKEQPYRVMLSETP